MKLGARSGSVTFDVVKGGRGGRTVTVPANVELREALADWIKIRPPVKHDLLFTSERWPYQGITRWSCHHVWHRRLAKHLPKDLADRAAWTASRPGNALARLLLDQGVPLPDVAAILGPRQRGHHRQHLLPGPASRTCGDISNERWVRSPRK